MNRALDIAADVRAQRRPAIDVINESLAAISRADAAINAFHHVFHDEALAQARRIDERIAGGIDPGPLAGVPFAAKSLFDVAGRATIAGSRARLDTPIATRDAEAIARLKQAGAVLVGTTHMDELACGATGENPFFGNVRNPRANERMTGGSSGGSAAAVAAGCVPLSLGSDTNGSIRAPAALCGVWGVKPTFGRLSRCGVLSYADSLDCIGGFARNVDDLAALYAALDGSATDERREIPRVAVLGGYFRTYASRDAWDEVIESASLFGPHEIIDMPEDEMQRARGAATIISNVEVAAAHGKLLDAPDENVSPRLRTRLIAGALSPAPWHAHALRYQQRFRARMSRLFDRFDLLLAPCTPFAAPRFTDATVAVGDHALEPAKHLGMLTQPVSFAGLPVIVAPVLHEGAMPLGVQIIGASFDEAACFAAARRIERGFSHFSVTASGS
ncbi:AtzE family amidohydrolase [Caballeronia sp. LZ065]|uniref:AtzE family amidohydrolase n=1 Tax=Caballeronia sp. LZ065 TaxID=3038571 RepID=UPI002861407E|nr:AtzE family amidohydrolase [Caballeronia sp. LZ065]MDR5781294.1 AtzE family amidohydrolase [Caballeronia sp. LZ065]